MNISHLKYALEVAKTGSINKAADNLYMNQPNLSRAIKELEETLGFKIFERTSRGMRVTESGEAFLERAKKILEDISELEEDYSPNIAEKIRFSISVPRASYISKAFVEFSKRLNKEKPTELFYKETNPMRTIDKLLKNEYKLGIVRYAEMYDRNFKSMLEEKGFAYEMLTEFKYVILMGKEHPLASKEPLNACDLVPFTEIAHSDPFVPSLPTFAVKKHELSDEIKKRIFVFERASQFELLSSNPETFMWVSAAPDDILERYGLVEKRCADSSRVYRDMLIYRKSYRLTEIDNMFIEELHRARDKYMK